MGLCGVPLYFSMASMKSLIAARVGAAAQTVHPETSTPNPASAGLEFGLGFRVRVLGFRVRVLGFRV